MAAQNAKKTCQLKVFAFLNTYYPKTNSLDSCRSYGRILVNKKTEGSRELYFGGDVGRGEGGALF